MSSKISLRQDVNHDTTIKTNSLKGVLKNALKILVDEPTVKVVTKFLKIL